MELEEYEIMYGVEDRHWWYLGMTAITRGLLDKFVGCGTDLTILDAGCGTGAGLDYLRNYGTAFGIDFSPEALRFCRKRGLSRLAQASVTDLPFADASFDLITSFDVLSEAGPGKDEQGLDEFLRVLKPGGHVLLRLPAYAWLHGGHHDTRVHTRRRYTRGQLKRMLREHGFVPVKMSYANSTLLPLAVAKRMSEKIVKPRHEEGSDLTISTGVLNRMFTGVLRAEAGLVRSVGLPFGLTVVGLAKKPA